MFFARPPQGLPETTVLGMQEHCQALMANAGYAQYEVSAYRATDGSARTTSLLAFR